MRIGPFEILKKHDVEELKKRVISLETKLDTSRPNIDEIFKGETGIKIPFYPMPPQSLYNLAYYSDVLRNILQALREEIFRNGWTFEKKYEYKCSQCGQEFDYEPEDHICPNCGGTLVEPDYDEVKDLEVEFKEGVNLNKQTLIDVMKEVEDDLNIMDDAYVLLIKDYIFDDEGNIIGGRVREILRGDPKFFRIIADEYGRPGRDDEGRRVMTCPIHRNEVYTDRTVCPKCGRKLQEAHFVFVKGDKKIYYLEDEVIHVSKYSPSILYGFSPIYSIWQKVVTLFNMDRYLMKYYSLQRNPKGLIFVNTRNTDSFKKVWREILDSVKQNPHMLHPIAIDSKEGSGNIAEYIDLSKPLPDMQYIETRNEMRRVIGSVYGVMPLFQADVSTSGGLNNEGLQITVTNRTVERGQQIYNEKIFPWLMKNLGVKSWKLVLNPNEEKDEMAELQREAQKIQNARMMLDMGFDVELDEYGNFKFSGEAKRQTLGGVAPNLPLLEEQSEQRFEGEPESVRRSLEKERVYIDDPSKAPEGVTVQQGPKGGYYYETEGKVDYSDLKENFNKNIKRKLEEMMNNGLATCPAAVVFVAQQLEKKGIPYKIVGGEYNGNWHYWVEADGKVLDFGNNIDKKAIEDGVIEPIITEENDKRYSNREEKYNSVKDFLNEMKDNPEAMRSIQTLFSIRKSIIEEEIEKFEKDNDLNYIKKKEIKLEDFLYPRVFEGLTKKESDKIRDILLKGFNERWTYEKLVKEIKKIVGDKITEDKALVIVRTEEASLRNNLREYMFKEVDPEGKFKYKWIGPLDERTSDICKEIMEKTAKGVSLDRLKKIIKDTARKYGVEARDFLPHPSCRHTFVRVM